MRLHDELTRTTLQTREWMDTVDGYSHVYGWHVPHGCRLKTD